MTSIVDTSVKYFDSTMPNAPTVSGTAGSLVALLDALLKDGFNTIAPTSITVAGGVATVNWSGTFAALKDTVVLIAGVTDKVGLNGEQKVTSKSPTSLTFATAESAGTATLSSATIKMAPLGWLKPFSGTSLAAYKSADPASTGCVFRLDDTGTFTIRVIGYEAMSDINTGVGPFPTTAQLSGGGYWTKSTNANATANAWQLIGDGRVFYLAIQCGYNTSPSNTIASPRMFGDTIGLKPGGDPYACVLNYSTNTSLASQVDAHVGTCTTSSNAYPREFTGVGSAVIAQAYCFGNPGSTNSGITANQVGNFPSPVDGSLMLQPKFHHAPTISPTPTPRAILPGCYHAIQGNVGQSFRAGDRVPGTGPLAGRTLITFSSGDASAAFSSAASVSNSGALFFDMTGPWR
jgi:hypothetical protein